MKISYAITVCNEVVEVQRLLDVLLKTKRPQDEVVVLFDSLNGTLEVQNVLKLYKESIQIHTSEFHNDFAEWKNKLKDHCSGDYIFQIDADEIPESNLIESLSEILLENDSVDLFLVPRINTVEGLTEAHIKQWNWRVDENGWVNFPDYQTRIYKNTSSIFWANKVHERIIGCKTLTGFPTEKEWCLHHPKTIERQEKQNAYYDTL